MLEFKQNYLNYLENLKNKYRFRNLNGRVSENVLYQTPQFNPSSSSINLDFTSNDYLGLSNNPKLLNAAWQAGKKYGIGATGSRLLSGDREIFITLEQIIARDKGTEAALIFNTGFQANFSVLSTLLDIKVLGKKPIVFFDKLNHASMYQAINLNTMELIRYRHNDLHHLAALLEQLGQVDRPKFIVTETLFGMDGDLVAIHDLINLAKQHHAFLYLDEAHATGVMGTNGYGLAAQLDFKGVNYLLMGTFSKAIGCSGGYIATHKIIVDYLINKCPGFVYTTAPSPMIAGAILAAWNLVKSMQAQRNLLLEQGKYLRSKLENLGMNCGKSNTHIVPIIMGEDHAVITYKNSFLNKGINLAAIRFPTVPIKAARLRIALNARHNQRSLDLLIEGVKNICVNV